MHTYDEASAATARALADLCLERLAMQHPDQDVVIVSHGGSIRAAVAHCLHVGADNALHLTVQNLSLTRLERTPEGWRVICVNELPGY